MHSTTRKWAAAALLATPITGLAAWAALAAPQQQTIHVTGSEYTFAPDQMYAKPSEALTVHLANVGQAPHNIVFELDGSREARSSIIQSGQSTSVSFDAPATVGRYTYYCSVGNHRVLGMVGTLRVEADPATATATVPLPTAAPWSLVADGLKNPHLLTVTGNTLAIAEGGTGSAPPGQFGPGNLDGRVTVLSLTNPANRGVVVDNLPNAVDPGGGVVGANHFVGRLPGAAVDPLGDGLMTLSGGTGHPDPKAQLLHVGLNGSTTVVADFWAFEAKNNPDGVPADEGGIDSNPWKMAWGPGDLLYVTDAGANTVLRLEPSAGELALYAVFEPVGTREDGSPISAVPTGIVFDPANPGVAYVALLGSFNPGEAQVRQLEDKNGDGDALDDTENTLVMDGLSTAVDLAYHPNGALFVAQLMPGTVQIVCETCQPAPFGGLAKPSGIAFAGNGDLLVSVAAPDADPQRLSTDRVIRVPADLLPGGGAAPTATPTGPASTATPEPTATATIVAPVEPHFIYLPLAAKAATLP